MTAAWVTIGCLALATAAIKAAGPVVLGGRELPEAALGVISLLAPALLGALVVTQTFAGEGRELTIDARVAGVAAAAVALGLRLSIVPTILLAATAAATVRLLGG
jgi:branched-subunit amino acid transport protein